MRIFIKTLGCKSNRYESDRIFEELKGKCKIFELNEGVTTFHGRIGVEKSKSNEKPSVNSDILIVNTCTVTQSADKKSRQAIRSFKKANSGTFVIVFGCGSNVGRKEYEKMKEVDVIAKDREEVLSILEGFLGDVSPGEDSTEATDCGMAATMKTPEDGFRTRAVVKIQDGCNNFCTYCIIPRARGPEVSYPSDEILDEVQKKEAQGFKEVVLTGIVASSWKEKGMDLADLIEKLIKNTDVVRFRLSSVEPKHYSDKFLHLFDTGRFCPHMHMSLQSGSDSVLKRMRRNYSVAEFLEACKRFRAVVPDIGLTTDVIVGFPGETDEEFEQTYHFVQKTGFLKMHVFPYSKRKNTPAYHMKDHVPDEVKRSRAAKLRKLSDKMALEFKKSLTGRKYRVLVETCGNGVCKGFTPNYLQAEFKGDEWMVNEFVAVEIKEAENDDVVRAIRSTSVR